MVKFLIILLLTAQVAVGANYTNAASGAFSVGATWTGGVAPSLTGDTWRIASGTTVWYDTDNSAHGGTPVAIGGWGASVVEGTLAITNGATVNAYLKMNGNLSGAGNFIIGTASDPITNLASAYPSAVVSMRAGRITMTKATGIMWYANTNQFTDYITNSTVVAGDNTNLWFTANVSNLASNDVICIDNHNTQSTDISYHVVYSVETNRVTVFNAITAGAQPATNTWYGRAMGTTIGTNARTNGTTVCKLSRPIVAMQASRIASTGFFNGAQSNTVSGVRFQNLGRGAVETVNWWNINSCVVATSTGGGMSYQGTNHMILSCIGWNTFPGAMSNTGTNHIISDCVLVTCANGSAISAGYNVTITNCISRNASGGGLAAGGSTSCKVLNCKASNGTGALVNNCSGFDIQNCAVTNWDSGGIAIGGYGNTISGCVAFNVTSGGIANTGFGFTIQNCVGISNTLGGIVSSGNGHTIQDCVGAGNTSGGISYLGTQNIINCSATNQAVPTIAYYPTATTILNTNGASLATEVTFQPSPRAPYDVLMFCGTNWASIGGLVYKTNIATTFSDTTLAHVPDTVLKAVPLYADISMKPYSGRSVGVWVYRTNDIAWSYEVTPFIAQPSALTSVPYATTGWFRTSVQLTNSLPKTMTQRLWLQSVSTNNLYVGYSWIDVPTDYTTQYQ